jgi:subtilisin family serine protease
MRMWKLIRIWFCILGLSILLLYCNGIDNVERKISKKSSPDPESAQGKIETGLQRPLLLRDPTRDPLVYKNWGLFKTPLKVDINILEAWKLQKGTKRITVAIIDTGIDYNHPDLRDNLWQNPGEVGTDANGKDKRKNGIDDDKNGFVDDFLGWDFVDNDNLPFDTHGHGTHVAGIIGAVGGNGIGTSGTCPSVSLMILKYYNPSDPGKENLKNTIRAIEYAVANGVDIINYSGGGPEFSYLEWNAIRKAREKGIIFVAAAGNEKQDSDLNYYYPAAYDLENILSVTAIDKNNRLLSSANYGVKKVDVSAPGDNIFSTLSNNRYGYMSGTSQATAFVTGVAALLKSGEPTWAHKEIKDAIVSAIDPVPGLKGKIATGGKLNAYAALNVNNIFGNLGFFRMSSQASFTAVDKETNFLYKISSLDENMKDILRSIKYLKDV